MKKFQLVSKYANYPKEPEINNLKVSFDAKEFKNYIKSTAIKAN